MFREVMSLPGCGKIKNLTTGEFERVDENLAKKILFVKNYITSLSKEKLTPKTNKNKNNNFIFISCKISTLRNFTSRIYFINNN